MALLSSLRSVAQMKPLDALKGAGPKAASVVPTVLNNQTMYKPNAGLVSAAPRVMNANLTDPGVLGIKAYDPNASSPKPPTTISKQFEAPSYMMSSPNSAFKQDTATSGAAKTSGASSVAGYYRQGNDVYDSQGNYISFAEAQKRGIVPQLESIPQKSTSSTTQKQVPAQQVNTSGNVTSGVFNPTTTTPTQQGTQTQPTTPAGQYQSPAQPGGLYGQLINQLAGTSQSINPMTGLGLLGYQQAQKNIADLQQQYNNKVAGIESTPMELDYQQGQKQILGRQYASNLAALQSAAQQQQAAIGFGQAQQGLAQQGLGSAAGLAAPMQFGLTMDPVTGQPINMSAMQVPLQTAMQLYQAGTPLSDPSYSQALGPVGSAGWMMFYNALQGGGKQGGFNPAAQSVAANQNLAFQGQTQAQSQQLGLGLAQLDAFQPKITQFMQASGINPSNVPIWNEQIRTYLDRIKNPGVSAQWNAMMTDIQSIAQSIITAKNAGGTPTSTTEMAALNNPSSLSMAQLTSVMDTWKNLGNTTLGVYQGQYGQAGGAPNAFLGGSSSTSPFITPAQAGKGLENTTLQGLGGVSWNVLSSPATLMAFVKSIFM